MTGDSNGKVTPSLRPTRIADVRDLYDSPASYQFYNIVVGDGGPHVHSGVYRSPNDSTSVAAEYSSTLLRELAEGAGVVFRPGVRVLDLGAGVGGAARKLATETGVSVTCFNLCSEQNAANVAATAEAGLEHLVSVVEGSFEELPAEWTDTFDIIWSQDAFCHSNAKARVWSEVSRVLVPGGHLMLIDLMAGEAADPKLMAPFCARLRVDELLTVSEYEAALQAVGVTTLRTRDLTSHLLPNYRRMVTRLTTERARLDRCSDAFVETVRGLLLESIEAMGQGEAQTWAALVGRKDGAPRGIGDAAINNSVAAAPLKRWLAAAVTGLTVTEMGDSVGGNTLGSGVGVCRALLAAAGIADYQQVEVVHLASGNRMATHVRGVDAAGACVLPLGGVKAFGGGVGDAVEVFAYADAASPVTPRMVAAA
ncbi:hypothetical protein MMPV_002797 [Pyropia vietnamensis]